MPAASLHTGVPVNQRQLWLLSASIGLALCLAAQAQAPATVSSTDVEVAVGSRTPAADARMPASSRPALRV